MKVKPLFFLLSFLLFQISCSKSSSSNRRETTIRDEQINEIMDNQNFDCASINGKACPDGVVRLLIVNPENEDQSAVCSGFMIGTNRLVTNYHCLSTAAQCNNTYIAIYTGNSYTKTRCSSIVRSEQDVANPNDPTRAIDYTVLETVDAYTGASFPLSHDDADIGDEIHVWVVDHTGLDAIPPNLTDSRITEFECEVMDSARASLVMQNCPIISGNSGSPALNTRGDVVGVVWGGTATFSSSLDLTFRRQLNEFGLATEVKYFSDLAP
ncbi:trypsin-like serine peptidase [Peredibacter sp. HCB2-198]|uniref:trypsin-like serine peptidase n=1 Tax=Peredibacter sp. HCB2-198 TaxID=3383025 RepID=UPI0038B67107